MTDGRAAASRAARSPALMLRRATIAAAVVAAGVVSIAATTLAPPLPADATVLVVVPAGTFAYRQAGEFLRDSVPVDPPLSEVTFTRPLAIMQHQVSRADYQRCVDAGACRAVAPATEGDAAITPVVGVNWHDAAGYAAWLSRETGQRYRLPTDAEWAYAAASLFRDNTIVGAGDPANPSARWLALYRSLSAEGAEGDVRPRPFGTFGVNDNGVADMAGNVWDWTSTCFVRTSAAKGRATTVMESCGVRVVEGRHRTYMTDFIRDPKGGACAVGTPPANLGIRLVRDDAPGLLSRIVERALRILGRDT